MTTTWTQGKFLTIKSRFIGNGSDEDPYTLECFQANPGTVWFTWEGQFQPGIKTTGITYLDLEKTPPEIVQDIKDNKRGIVSVLGETDKVPIAVEGY